MDHLASGHFLYLPKFKGPSRLLIKDKIFYSPNGCPITSTPTGRPLEPITFCLKARVSASLPCPS